MPLKSSIPFAAAIAIIIGLQVLVTATGTSFYLTQLTMAAYYSLVAVGLCLLMGYAGQISMGHAALFAIGGYGVALCNTLNLAPWAARWPVSLLVRCGLTVTVKDYLGASALHLHPWLGLALSIAAAVVAALLIGIPALRLKGHYLAMATLGFGTIVYRLLVGTSLFGSADGISDVGGFDVLPGLRVCGDGAYRCSNYYLAWGCVLGAALLVRNLVNSRPGRALRSIHGNEEAANAMGVNTARFKLYVFVFSAVLASLAGALLTYYSGGIGPAESGVMKSVRYVAIVAVGGMANLWGTIIASVVLNFLSLRGYFGKFDDAVFGAILVGMMMLSNNDWIKALVAKRDRRIK